MNYQHFICGTLFLLSLTWLSSEACSCAPQHPQQAYCQSDFVIIGTPKAMNYSKQNNEVVYKLKIRNVFKMSEKAKVALKSGMVYTPGDSAMCGRELALNHTYLITGRILNLQAKINLCNFVEPWKKINPRQRKGFKMLYRQGCACQIQYCTSPANCRLSKSNHKCKWLQSYTTGVKCHHDYGICFLNKYGICHWGMAKKLTSCLHSYSLTTDLKSLKPIK